MVERFSADRVAAVSHVEITAKIVSAYVSNNAVPVSDIGELIRIVRKSLDEIVSPRGPSSGARVLRPAVPIKDSVTGDYIICLEDGRRFTFIKNHIETIYNLTPGEYRAKWGLPADYPMVAPNYSALRSRMAKELGLGGKTKKALVR
ncbi:MucR family transcriptional regulator [Aminobacter anthyllidis]|uniref:MucR family transcriptional regulator n=1 Tax=Aminobacter anthyllidis TaxID=1035067 RepID=UPI002455B163|nr:MucR family transcriptional regulator [Aminobacter anthyllidis]MDH4984330.1 MucR family transcriptional regulator [Aminobacter anthyllidis]